MGNTQNREVPELPEPPALPGSVEDLEKLKTECVLYFPGSAEYNEHRMKGTWSMDPETFGKPSAILVPRTAEDVLKAVQYCAKYNFEVCVSCGRHVPSSIRQGTLMIDMTNGMNDVTVDPIAKRITIAGGAKLGKIDAACKEHNFILPLGRVPTTGCAGQMLYTGAHGYCERTFGLGVDYMISATVVLTNGIFNCSETENSDLFWGIRGGQSNFGIVCEMVFNVKVAPNNGQFMASQRVYLPTGILGMPTRQACMDYLISRQDVNAPDEYNISATFIGGGGGSPCIITEFWFGENPTDGATFFKAGPKYPGYAVSDNTGVHDYWNAIQKWANGPKGEDVGPGAYYFRGHMCKVVTPAMGNAIVAALNAPFPTGCQPVAIIDMMGGGVSSRVDPSAMALPIRPNFWIIIICGWEPKVTGPEGREFAKNWCHCLWKQLMDISLQDCVDSDKIQVDSHTPDLNEMLQDTVLMGQQAKLKDIWGDNAARMREVKQKYDPSNFFGSNITPA